MSLKRTSGNTHDVIYRLVPIIQVQQTSNASVMGSIQTAGNGASFYVQEPELEPVLKSDPQKICTNETLPETKFTRVCGVCRKGFSTLQQLNQHMLVHTDERRHRCQFCERAFKQLSHLQQHHRIHTGEKPYRCTVAGCSRAFPQLSNLQHHLRCQHKTATPSPPTQGQGCQVCDEKFPDRDVARRHMLEVHNISSPWNTPRVTEPPPRTTSSFGPDTETADTGGNPHVTGNCRSISENFRPVSGNRRWTSQQSVWPTRNGDRAAMDIAGKLRETQPSASAGKPGSVVVPSNTNTLSIKHSGSNFEQNNKQSGNVKENSPISISGEQAHNESTLSKIEGNDHKTSGLNDAADEFEYHYTLGPLPLEDGVERSAEQFDVDMYTDSAFTHPVREKLTILDGEHVTPSETVITDASGKKCQHGDLCNVEKPVGFPKSALNNKWPSDEITKRADRSGTLDKDKTSERVGKRSRKPNRPMRITRAPQVDARETTLTISASGHIISYVSQDTLGHNPNACTDQLFEDCIN